MENNTQSENKFEKMEEKQKEDNSVISDKIFKYIYFIITYDISKQLKIYLSTEYKGSDTLEKINDKPYKKVNELLTSDVYRFRIIEDALELQKDQQEYKIPVIVERENEKCQYEIKLKDLKKDFLNIILKLEN